MRLEMLSWDAATCWQSLEEFCEEGKDARYINEIGFDYACQIVGALARYGQECEEKVHGLLSQTIDDYSHHPMKWMEPLAVRLAGRAQLESTVPLIVAKLHEEADILNGECSTALARIGTAAVVRAVAEAFPAAESRFRRYAATALERIHSDLAVETCVQLLAQEQDRDTRIRLIEALLFQFTDEGIEAARQRLMQSMSREFDFDDVGLRELLLETCAVTGQRFPEYEAWLAAEQAEKAEHSREMEELEGNPMAQIQRALEKMTGETVEDVLKDIPALTTPSLPKPTLLRPSLSKALMRSSLTTASRFDLPSIRASKQSVGRNDACPCGSGKKFKKCCLGKSDE